MNETMNRRLLGPVMFWTVLTTLFAWLPLVRIIGRPEGYTWSILGLSGDGLDGPFWIFIPLTAYAITMLFTAERGPRALFHPLLVLWHLIVTGVVIAALVQGGGDAMWQGQGLHLKIPLWILAVPFVFFAVLAGVWAAVDRSHPVKAPSRWSARNTFRLLASLLLLVLAIVQLGNHHEQQHQELILTDIKHVFSCNPLDPAYRRRDEQAGSGPVLAPANWLTFEEGLMDIGFGGARFCFDNERPRHQTLVHPFRIQDRLVTNREYLEFVEDGGYQRPELWLSLGWNAVSQQSWESPLYWRHTDADWYEFTLAGLQPLVPDQPVCHVSLFEADAYARWVKARLPTEFEWECAAAREAIAGTFAESNRFHPAAATATQGLLRQCFGDVWEWTSSQYQAYPGYRPASGAFGEYNGKFMCNQFVLRGGSCATPESHMRATYRNFFPPDARWQFAGIRLAE